MAKNKNKSLQQKADNPEEVKAVSERLSQLSDNDKGMVLRRTGITYLQSRWRPLMPTPELRPLVNWTGRLTTLINLMMRLMTSRRLPVEDLTVISETKLRQNTIEPAVELLKAQCREIEKVLDKNRGNSGSGQKQAELEADFKGEEDVEFSEPETAAAES